MTLTARLSAIDDRIAEAARRAGRDPGDITRIVVTKFHPAQLVRDLRALGVTEVGENRQQELTAKRADLVDLDDVRWHFIGQLQTNKARHVAGYADVVHSVDRVRLVRALGTAARAAGRDVTCLVQVSLDPADAADGPRDAQERGGVPPARLAEVAAAIEAEQGLVLGGLMAVAPRFTDPAAAFAPLRELSDVIRSVNPSATVVSAGMSGDLEAAVGNGATHLRIGTALLGDRRLPVL